MYLHNTQNNGIVVVLRLSTIHNSDYSGYDYPTAQT